MPTPSIHEIDSRLPPFTSCPPEDDRETSWRVRPIDPDALIHDAVESAMNVETPTNLLPLGGSEVLVGPTESYTVNPQQTGKQMDIDEDGPLSESLSPVSTQDTKESSQRVAMTDNYLGSSTSTGYEASNIRLMPSAPSSFLRAGSQFKGTQQSERQVYDVQVDIKHVDMRESFLCGYLRIQGLTEDHPTLTTYFEGEIIGSKYSFLTQHEDWGSTDKVDLQHWAKFQAFRPFAKQARKGNLHIPHLAQRENIFMRWKEHFLVPDHRVRTITGASFEGFYYICFNQVAGTISGIYFHAKSEKFQQLELAHVEDRGCFSSMEFR